MTKFWMLHADEIRGKPASGHDYSPTRRHASQQEAETEAAKLASRLGVAVHLMESVGTCEAVRNVTWDRGQTGG